MARVVSDINRHLALEVARGQATVAFVSIDGAALSLRRMPAKEFDQAYPVDEVPMGTAGVSPTPRHYARVMLRSTWEVNADAAHAMLAELPLSATEPRPEGVVVLAAGDGSFLGAYSNLEDAMLARKYYHGAQVVPRASVLFQWPAEQFTVLRQQVAPTLKGRDSRKLREGVFHMATVADKPTAPAPAKIESTKKERAPKGDGPVALVAAYIKSNEGALRAGKLTRADAASALRSSGLNKSTVGVQLVRQLTALGIKTERGTRAKVKPEAKPGKPVTTKAEAKPGKAPAAKKPAAKKPAAKKPAAKKPAAKKAPAKGSKK